MSILDSLLPIQSKIPVRPPAEAPVSAPPAPVSVAPAEGTGVAVAPPKPTGVLGRALELTGAVDAATDKRLAASPIMDKINAQTDLLEKDFNAAIPQVQALSAQAQALASQPDPARPAVPRLKPLPPIPTLEEIAKQRGVKTEDFDNPMRVFGQFMPVMIAIGALATQKSGIMALNAATAAMTAVREGDKDAYQKAHREWLESTKATTDENQALVSEYKMVLEDRALGQADKQAKLASIAAQKQDVLGVAALRQGLLDQFWKLQEFRTASTKPVADMVQLAVTEEQNNKELAVRSAIEWAKLEEAQNPAFVSTDRVVGNILRDLANGKTLTPQQEDALLKAKEQREASSPSFMGAGGAYGLGGTPPAAAAPVTATPTTATPAPAATGVPPVSMLKEGVITPLNPPNGGPAQKWTLRGGKPVQVG